MNISKLLQEDGVLNFNYINIEPTSGFMVNMEVHTVSIDKGDLTPALLKGYCMSKAYLMCDPMNFIKKKTIDNKVFLDISCNIINKEEAILLGLSEKRDNIFDINNNRLIKL